MSSLQHLLMEDYSLQLYYAQNICLQLSDDSGYMKRIFFSNE